MLLNMEMILDKIEMMASEGSEGTVGGQLWEN